MTVQTDPQRTYGDAGREIVAISTLGLPVTLSVASGPCELINNTVATLGAGSCQILATQSGDTWHKEASDSVDISIARRVPTVTITAPDSALLDNRASGVTARSSAGVLVKLIGSGACAASGEVISYTGSGVCRVQAISNATDNYESATAEKLINVRRAQEISMDAFVDRAANAGPLPLRATSTGGLPVVITTAGACGVEGSQLLMRGAGTCTITVTQSGNEEYAPVTSTKEFAVNKVQQTISVALDGSLQVGGGPAQVVATSTSPLPVGATVSGNCTISNGIISPGSSSGSCAITATQAGNDIYYAAAAPVLTVPVAAKPPAYVPQPSSTSSSPSYSSGVRIGAICRDGWRSTATGSGACSWHGGVSYWLTN